MPSLVRSAVWSRVTLLPKPRSDGQAWEERNTAPHGAAASRQPRKHPATQCHVEQLTDTGSPGNTLQHSPERAVLFLFVWFAVWKTRFGLWTLVTFVGSEDAGQTLGMVGSQLENIWVPNNVVEPSYFYAVQTTVSGLSVTCSFI